MTSYFTLARIDLWVRVGVVIALIGVSVHSLASTGVLRAEWLAAKVLVFWTGLVANAAFGIHML